MQSRQDTYWDTDQASDACKLYEVQIMHLKESVYNKSL